MGADDCGRSDLDPLTNEGEKETRNLKIVNEVNQRRRRRSSFILAWEEEEEEEEEEERGPLGVAGGAEGCMGGQEDGSREAGGGGGREGGRQGGRGWHWRLSLKCDVNDGSLSADKKETQSIQVHAAQLRPPDAAPSPASSCFPP